MNGGKWIQREFVPSFLFDPFRAYPIPHSYFYLFSYSCYQDYESKWGRLFYRRTDSQGPTEGHLQVW